MNENMGSRWFAELVATSFVERDGANILATDPDCALRNRPSFDTLSDLEAGCTHVHVLDHFENEAELPEPTVTEDGCDLYYDAEHPDFRAACDIGVGMVHTWAAHLKSLFPGYQFRVYYTELDNPIVRCHRVRESEAPWLSDDDVRAHGPSGRALVLDTSDGRIIDSKHFS
jgi:hypothetical protein